MSPKKEIKSADDLLQIIREEKERPEYNAPVTKKNFKPVYLDGSNISNFKKGGYPTFAQLKLVIEEVLNSGSLDSCV